MGPISSLQSARKVINKHSEHELIVSVYIVVVIDYRAPINNNLFTDCSVS